MMEKTRNCEIGASFFHKFSFFSNTISLTMTLSLLGTKVSTQPKG